MRSIKERLALWHIVLIVGITATIAIPAATAHIGSTKATIVTEQPEHISQQTGSDNLNAYAGHPNTPRVAVARSAVPPQDDYYQQRRQYWEKRLDGRLDHQDLDEDTGDDGDDKNANAGDDDDDASDKNADSEEEAFEKRREYWRERLDEDW